jgi:hypothetical protein
MEKLLKGESDPTQKRIASCNLRDKAGDVKDASLKRLLLYMVLFLTKKLFARAVKINVNVHKTKML